MSSLIANQVKTNMYFILVKLFIILTTFVPLFILNRYNNNCLFNTAIRYSAHNRNSLFTRNLSQGCLNYY